MSTINHVPELFGSPDQPSVRLPWDPYSLERESDLNKGLVLMRTVTQDPGLGATSDSLVAGSVGANWSG
jgi:hypothetical protein